MIAIYMIIEITFEIIPSIMTFSKEIQKILLKTFEQEKSLQLDQESPEIQLKEHGSDASDMTKHRYTISDQNDRAIIELKINEFTLQDQFTQPSTSVIQFGILNRAKLTNNRYSGKLFICRRIPANRLSQYLIEEINQDIQSYRKLVCPYLIQIKAIHIDPDYIYFFLPYFDHQSLGQIILSQNNDELIWKLNLLSQRIYVQVCQYLHDNNICHGQLKSNNILISKNNQARIVDFGLNALKKFVSLTTGYTTKSQFNSPELLQERSSTPLVTVEGDIYAFGMITWEVFHMKQAFPCLSIQDLTKLIATDQKRPKIDEYSIYHNLRNIPDDMKMLIRACWQAEPQKRPRFSKIIQFLEGTLQNLEQYINEYHIDAQIVQLKMAQEETQKLHTQIPEHLWYGTGSPTRKSNQGKTLPRQFYQSDGTGRDTFVIGNIPDRFQYNPEFPKQLRKYNSQIFSSPRNPYKLPPLEERKRNKLSQYQRGLDHRLSVPKLKTKDQYFLIYKNMGNTCNQLCLESEIIVVPTKQQLQTLPTEQDQNLTSPTRNYFQENKEVVIPNAFSVNREKRDIYKYQTGAIYDGEWIGGLRDGYGVMIWADGARYEGYWSQNRATGKGNFTLTEGDTYEGEWLDDKANGYGIYVHVNGAKYEGYWKKDQQDGYGIEQWSDGSVYEGKYIWPDGSKYNGQWSDNAINGQGVYCWLDGRQYEGEWLNNNMHMDMKYIHGEMVQDMKEGFGIYIWEDGRKYEGEWVDGKQHGKGKYYEMGKMNKQ
ncbi:hypothetical protein pb186bvf_006313 [Paramecium bursaria]